MTPAGIVYLVEERENPSTDYFVLPVFQAAGLAVVRCGFADLPESAVLNGATVAFVRYVPAPWARWIEAHRSRIGRLIYFMDDDLLDPTAWTGLSLRYRWKLLRLAAWRRGWLARQGAEVWVSTEALRLKYQAWQPRRVQPSPVAAPVGVRRVFYHGSASHAPEVRWLRPIVEELLRRHPALGFEIVGDAEVNRLYRGLSRVAVIHPTSWAGYQGLLAAGGRHVGLAPLLDSGFNRGRSCTKFFDITRAGAAGVYSAGPPCGEVIRAGVEGLVVGNDPEAWVAAISRLVVDDALREAIVDNALRRVQVLRSEAEAANRGLVG